MVPSAAPEIPSVPGAVPKAGAKRMKVRDVLTLDVEDVVLGGQALARVDGRVVFVDRGLPGDRVTARVAKVNRRSAEARLLAIDSPSETRVAARCVHVGRCGGCGVGVGYEDGEGDHIC